MRLLKTISTLILTGFINATTAQVIDNTASFRETGRDKYIRYSYDNDFFTATDQYYTQGMLLEWVNPVFKKSPLSKLLIHPKNFQTTFGIAVEHLAYTPTSIRHTEIIYHDRPFAACLFYNAFAIAKNKERGQRITSKFSMGVIGPAAGGEEMQTSIHRWLKNITPLGWSNQVANDVIINYELGYEKTVLDKNKIFRASWNSKVNVGTLNNKLSLGFIAMAGLPPTFTDISESEKKKLKFHFYNQCAINLVGYDASLQGGLFNKESPYTINSTAITRFTFQDNAGVSIKLHNIYLEYFQSVITKEFRTGKYHRWGGIRIGWEL